MKTTFGGLFSYYMNALDIRVGTFAMKEFNKDYRHAGIANQKSSKIPEVSVYIDYMKSMRSVCQLNFYRSRKQVQKR